MNIFEHLICPVCSLPLSLWDKTLRCENKHSFDISSSGYVNLLKPGKKNNAKAGDSKEMIRARTSFFESGAYEGISNKICELVNELKPSLVIDAGCGEGYYTQNIAKLDTSCHVIGIDMSKFGCEHGAKVAKRNGIENLIYSVGSIFELPVDNGSADLIINMFAPVASEEFLRVLRVGGHFIVASAGVEHLNGLKRVLYEEIYKNDEKILNYDGAQLVRCDNLKYDIKICGNDAIKNLFSMTPYYHRTSLDDKKKLDDVDEINTTIEVNFAIYKKI